jgi:hypothetical protein
MNIAYVHAEAQIDLNVKLRAQKMYNIRKLQEQSFEVGEKVLWLHSNAAKLEYVETLRGGQQARRMALLHVGEKW